MTEKEENSQQPASSLAISSLVLGVVSLTGPGLLLGIPAIITASIALKKGHGGRGLSIAGLVTGIVSTVLSLLFVALIVLLVVLGAAYPGDEGDHTDPKPQQKNEQLFDATRT